MSDTPAPLAELAAFTARQREASLTGSLVGLSLPERDQILQAQFARFDAALEAARRQAEQSGRPVSFDGAMISLTDGGDTWTAHPDGALTRAYERFDGFGAFLAQVAGRPAVDPARPVSRDELLDCAYHGFWAPSATNWQPVRMVELAGPARDALCALAGWPVPPAGFPLFAVLRRDHYESLLGDVLEPFGLEVTAREESIDVGIFVQTLIMSALGRGLTVDEREWAPGELPEAARVLTEELERRVQALAGATAPLAAQEREALAALLEALRRGKYIPDSLVAIGHPQTPVAPFPAFARVIAEHSTQRVASPSAEFGHDAVMALWDAAVRTLPEADRGLVHFADFSWHDQVPSRIGRAMFESLYGLGADPETKTGGDGGILMAVTVRNFLLHTAKTSPDFVAAHMPAGWEAEDDAALRRIAKGVPTRAQDLGRYMLERILRDGKYRVEGGLVVDAEGNPLTLPLLVRLMKSLASTFGNFFLKFQNTHPQNAVLLAEAATGDPHHAYRAVGKVAAVLTFASRAEGASSIIKTGPIDLARDPVGAILAENPDHSPHLAPWREGLLSGRLLPAMTFQVGMPLGGSDVIDPGTPGEHTGLEERKRDKRPPREDFTWHFFPAL